MKRSEKTRIMVFGTFDMIHKGHLDFFKQARSLADNPFLIVSVARSKNVLRIKGYNPGLGDRLRQANLKKLPLIDKVVLGGLKDHIPHIIKARPDIIALGYDQKAYVDKLKKDLHDNGIDPKIVRLKPYKPHLYKTQILKKKLTN